MKVTTKFPTAIYEGLGLSGERSIKDP